jgi:hypothetical protein
LFGACAGQKARASRLTETRDTVDVAVVPGCPSESDGSLSPCQARRAVWAKVLWERGQATHFITSGGAVHSRYVEAEGLAAALFALGVPAERIYLDPDALHTDENMYNSMRIARKLGFRRVAVASEGMQAEGGCRMMHDWGQPCQPLSMEHRLVAGQRERLAKILSRVRAARVPDSEWVEVDERERRLAGRTGRPRRPPSFLLYPWMGILRLSGHPWVPFAPEQPTILTWYERSQALSATR